MTTLLIMMINSTLMMFLKHPLTLGLSILFQTILTSLMIGTLYINFWYSYILTLIMIGGLLILFIYMTSIASNEKFKFSINLTLLSLMMLIFIFLTIFFMNWKLNNMYMTNNFTFPMNDISKLSMYNSMNKYFNLPQMKIMMIIIIYLLITMIMMVKICKIKSGPLRQMF